MVLQNLIEQVWQSTASTLALLLSGCLSVLIASALLSGALFVFVRRLRSPSKRNNVNRNRNNRTNSQTNRNILLCRNSDERQCCSCSRRLAGFAAKFVRSCRHCFAQHCYHCSYENNNACKNCHPIGDKWDVSKLDRLKNNLLLDKMELFERENSGHSRDVEVREFMEHLIETLVGNGRTDLDDIPDASMEYSPRYVYIRRRYHTELSKTLTTLSDSLHSVIDDKIIDEQEQPSFIYMQLKSLIKQIHHQVRNLPSANHSSLLNSEISDTETNNEVDVCRSYEDIMATVVLHQIMSKCRPDDKDQAQSSVSYSNDGTSYLDETIQSDNSDSSDSSSIINHRNSTSLTLEEYIEEVTTTTTKFVEQYSDEIIGHGHDDGTETNYRGKNSCDFSTGLWSNCSLNGKRAHFPELGKDVVDGGGVPSSDDDEICMKNCPPDGKECYICDCCCCSCNYSDSNNQRQWQRQHCRSRMMEIRNAIDSWQDNWLFRRKVRIRRRRRRSSLKQDDNHHYYYDDDDDDDHSDHHIKYRHDDDHGMVTVTVSVPMLVPNPSEDYRALIGELDADETSDLSECSDSVLEELIHPTTNDMIISSPKVIVRGAIYENHSTSERTNVITSTTTLTQHKTNPVKIIDWSSPPFSSSYNTDDQESSGVTSISRDMSDMSSTEDNNSSNNRLRSSSTIIMLEKPFVIRQDDSGEGSLDGHQEYYNECAREQFTSNTSAEISVGATMKNDNLPPSPIISHQPHEFSNESSLTDETLFSPPKPGTIAEREHLKWQQANPLANNPYSKENLQKRMLHQRFFRTIDDKNFSSNDNVGAYENYSSAGEVEEMECSSGGGGVSLPDYKLYGRDYYINTTQRNLTNEKIKSKWEVERLSRR